MQNRSLVMGLLCLVSSVFLNGCGHVPVSCNDLYEVATATAGVCGSYSLENPPLPGAGAGEEMFYRWVPLCEDGSGDHEWSNTGGASGTPPTCLADDYIRCIDGTRPLYYIDKARTMDGLSDDTTNDWAFWFQGGGSCADGEGVSAGIHCHRKYMDDTEADEMGSTTSADSLTNKGLLDPNHVDNVFKTFNRVRIMKCSYDRFAGTATLTGNTNNLGDQFALYWHGRRQIEAVLSDLKPGVGFDDENGANTLPPLADATSALFAGHSGGSGGLILNGDWLADSMVTMQPAAKVRLLFDARWKASLESEAHWAPGFSVASDDTNGDGVLDAYDHIAPTVSAPGQLPGGFNYSRYKLVSGGGSQIQQDQWQTPLDASCEALYHDGAARCRDEMHTLLNHISTPFFVRQALHDNNHLTHPVAFAVDSDFRFTDIQQQDRAVFQFNTLVESHRTLSELALAGPTPTWSFGVFAPVQTDHVGVTDKTQFFDVELCPPGGVAGDEISYHDALVEWFTNDTEIVAVEDPLSTTGEYCDASGPACC